MSKSYERKRAQQLEQKRLDRLERQAAKRKRNLIVTMVVVLVGIVIAVAIILGSKSPDADSGYQDGSGDNTTSPSPAPSESPDGVTDPQRYEAAPPATDSLDKDWDVTLHTSAGDIGMILDGAKAPQAVASFNFLASRGYFDGTGCHRLLPTSLLQCGDPTGTGTGGPGYSFGPVENAPADEIYPAGTVAMARIGNNGESMGSQFFLVFEDVRLPADSAGGYTVMGTITSGLDILRDIGKAGTVDGSMDGSPSTSVIIESVEVK